jgi:hypothetical protein
MNKNLAMNLVSMALWLTLVTGAMLALKHSFDAQRQPAVAQPSLIDAAAPTQMNMATLPAQEDCKTLMKNMNEINVALKLVATTENSPRLRLQLQTLHEKFTQQGCK